MPIDSYRAFWRASPGERGIYRHGAWKTKEIFSAASALDHSFELVAIGSHSASRCAPSRNPSPLEESFRWEVSFLRLLSDAVAIANRSGAPAAGWPGIPRPCGNCTRPAGSRSHRRRCRRHTAAWQRRGKGDITYFRKQVTCRLFILNLLRAKLAADMKELGKNRYSGHSVLVGKVVAEWQNTKDVLEK